MFNMLRYKIEGIAQDVSFAFTNLGFTVWDAATTVADTVGTALMLGFFLVVTVRDAITPDTIKKEIPKQLSGEMLKKAFAAKVKEKEKDSVSVSVLDEWDEEVGEVDVNGESVSDEIHVGMVISLQ